MIYSQFVYCDEALNPTQTGYCRQIPTDKSNIDSDAVSHFKTFKLNYYNQTEGFTEDIFYAQDKDISYKMEEVGRLKFIDKALYYYRVQPKSLQRDANYAGLEYVTKAKISALQRRNEKNAMLQKDALMHFTIALDNFYKEDLTNAESEIETYQRLIKYDLFPKYDNRKIDNPLVSIIVVAYQTNELLIDCLTSLLKQSETNFEIIIVDNGGNDKVLKQLLALPILYIKCPINFVLSEGRNIGAHFAKADIIASLDDDATVPNNYVESLLKAFREYDIYALRGKVIPKHPDKFPAKIGVYDLGDIPIPSSIDAEGNSAYSKKVYQALNGMNPLLFGGEGLDLSIRILNAYGENMTIYWPKTVIFHDPADSEKDQIKEKRYSLMHKYLGYKYPFVWEYHAHLLSYSKNSMFQQKGHSLLKRKSSQCFAPDSGQTCSNKPEAPYEMRLFELSEKAGQFLEQGNPGEALSILDEILVINPTFHDLQFARAIALFMLGRNEESIAAAQEELATQPNHEGVRELLSRIDTMKQESVVKRQGSPVVRATSPGEITKKQAGQARIPLRFMQVDTFYHRPIELLYAADRGLSQSSFSEQMDSIFRNGFAAVHTVGPYMRDAGYEVQWIVGNCLPAQHQWTREHDIRINDQNWIYQIVRAQVEAFKPDILYTTDCMVFDSNFIRTLSYKPSLVIGWQASDIPANTDWSEFDIIFSPLSALREEALRRGALSAVDFLPGFPAWIYESVKDIQPTYDVVFCGQWTLDQHKRRNYYLNKIAEASKADQNFSCAFYLSGQPDVISSEVLRHQIGERYGINMNKALRTGRIGFDAKGFLRSFGKTKEDVRDVAGKETANMRIFETTGCGVFLLTEYHENLSKFFEIGKEIETFADEYELIDKIRYYLEHEREREEIARLGHERCLRDHSMSKRAGEFNKIIMEKLYPISEMRTAGVDLSEGRERLQPISRLFGFDRGTPIDRYYIENFLAQNSSHIRGRVLEIGDNTYTQKYGIGVTKSEVLNAVPSSNATIVGDLATGKNIPENAFDCIILTQTLLCIYDVKSALKNTIKALKSGGTLLITVPGISQISRYDMDRWGDYWRFTDKSLKMLIEEAAPDSEIEIQTFGNVAVAKAYLDGLALEEFPKEILDYYDNDYQVILTAKVKNTVKDASSFHADKKTTTSLATPLVLLYHRVADDPIDSQLLCTAPKFFEAHLKELSKNYRVIPLYELAQELKRGKLKPDTVALTFDDGYLDNLPNAVPLLEKYKLPATIFVTSGMVGSEQEFWWDALERVFLTGGVLPESLEITFQSGTKVWDLRTAQGRLKAYDELCAILRLDSFEDILQSVHDLFEWASLESSARISHRIVNQEQLKKLAGSPFIEIGSHSVTHTRLGILSLENQRQEIRESKQQLETIIKKRVRLFSYPYGGSADFSRETAGIVSDEGYEAGIANIQGSIAAPINLYAIPRRLVRNWSGDVFAKWMKEEDKCRLEAETISEREKKLIDYQLTLARKQDAHKDNKTHT